MEGEVCQKLDNLQYRMKAFKYFFTGYKKRTVNLKRVAEYEHMLDMLLPEETVPYKFLIKIEVKNGLSNFVEKLPKYTTKDSEYLANTLKLFRSQRNFLDQD